MLDPRIYRTGLIAVALGLIVLAFSLIPAPGPLTTTLAPEEFNGQKAYGTMTYLADKYPDRRPGSAGDEGVAAYVSQGLAANHYNVARRTFSGHTPDGIRRLETVTGTVTGLSNGTIVVVAHRDSVHAPAAADLSGTAVLLELSRVLAEGTHQRTIVLASTSGSVGAVGATQLARSLPAPIDAVIVLGDLAATKPRSPIVIPWSNSHALAPPLLRNTVAATLASQVGLAAGASSLGAQFVRLAFPMAVGEQGPFAAFNEPAVLVSLSGPHAPAADEPTSPDRVAAMGRALLQTIDALDGGRQVPGPSAYLLYDGKVIPAWAIRLLVLALILPVLATTIDGFARVRRRHHATLRWLFWVLSFALPFALPCLLVVGLRLVGALDSAPPQPLDGAAIALQRVNAAILAAAAVLLVVTFAARYGAIRLIAPSRRASPSDPGAAAALLIVLCAVSLAIWYTNPFAAVLIVPALHLWMWVMAPSVRAHKTAVLALLAAGVAIPVVAVLYFASALGLGPIALAWSGVLGLGGGSISLAAALEWSVALGCVVSLAVIGVRAQRQRRPEELPVTIRGPLSYAGPGSLGGTESALRR